MNPEMERIRADYLNRLRRSMKGLPRQVTDEVEQEIHNHIEDALADRGEQSVCDLLDVLDRLGPPEEFARDLGLYVMVDRGYHEWSVPHMVRSTAFWSMGTVAGAIAFLAFGLLFVVAGVLALSGLMSLISGGLYEQVADAPPDVDRHTSLIVGVALVAAGLIALAIVAAMARWFVGEYVHMARPHMLGGGHSNPEWQRRASRRIVLLAGSGLGVALLSWVVLWAAYAFGVGQVVGIPLPPAPPSESVVAMVFLAVELGGFLLFLLSPVLGLLWTRVAERSLRSSKPDELRSEP